MNDRLYRKIEQLERVQLLRDDDFGLLEAAAGVVNAWRDIYPKRIADRGPTTKGSPVK